MSLWNDVNDYFSSILYGELHMYIDHSVAVFTTFDCLITLNKCRFHYSLIAVHIQSIKILTTFWNHDEHELNRIMSFFLGVKFIAIFSPCNPLARWQFPYELRVWIFLWIFVSEKSSILISLISIIGYLRICRTKCYIQNENTSSKSTKLLNRKTPTEKNQRIMTFITDVVFFDTRLMKVGKWFHGQTIKNKYLHFNLILHFCFPIFTKL